MITITASITKQFFGEPTYIGELMKDLTTAALGLDRGELRFVHQPNTDESPKAAISFLIDTVGNDDVAQRLERALQEAMKPAKWTFDISFTEMSQADITFDTGSQLDDALLSAQSNSDSMLDAHMERLQLRPFDELDEYIDETMHDLKKLFKE